MRCRQCSHGRTGQNQCADSRAYPTPHLGIDQWEVEWLKSLRGDALIELTAERIARIRVSEEGQEGLTAFFEKRAPNWQK